MSLLHQHPLVAALLASIGLALAVWVISVFRRDVSIVDRVWSLLILASASTHLVLEPQGGWRTFLVLGLAVLWAVRLALHITIRGWGEPEDRRYQQIRERNQPGFAWKSAYLVFGLQAVLAWVVSFALISAFGGPRSVHWLDVIGVVLVVAGIVYEAVADWQLARFLSGEQGDDKVMDQGLWRYSRHPNYFGEFCLWWGFFCFAMAGQADWWAVLSPILMSFLLLRVSGVTLLEKDMSSRRPAYADYVEKTNAFFPGPVKS